MRPSQQLRLVGWLGVVLGALGVLVGVSLWAWFMIANPIRTVGVHGMLPEIFHSILLGMFAGIAAAGSLYVAGVGWLCTRPGRAAWLGAMVGGGIGCLVPIVAPILDGIWTRPMSRLLLVTPAFANLPARMAFSYVTALGLAAYLEHASPTWMRPAWLVTLPFPLAGVLFAAGLTARRAVEPLTLKGRVKQDMVRHDACEDAADLDVRCGPVQAFAQSSAAIVLVTYTSKNFFTLSLERFEAVVPRRLVWKTDLPLRRDSSGFQVVLAVSPDGTRIAVAGANQAWMVDGATGALLRTLEPCQTVGIWRPFALAFSPDGSTLAVGQESICLRPVEPSGGVERRIEVPYPRYNAGTGERAVSSLVFDATGRVVWANRGLLGAWDVDKGERVVAIDQTLIEEFALAPDGGRVVTTSESGLETWDAHSGQLLGRLDRSRFPGGHAPRANLAFLPDGRILIASLVSGYQIADPVKGSLSTWQDTQSSYQWIHVDAARGSLTLSSNGTSLGTRPTVEFRPMKELLATF